MLIDPRRSLYQSLCTLTTATLSIVSVGLMPPGTRTLLAAEHPVVAASSAGYPIVRSAVLEPNLRVPWSQPVRVSDPFEGEYLAVFDQNYFNRLFRNTNSQIKVVSLWSRDSIRLLLAYSGRECTFGDSFNSLRSDRFYPLSRRYRRFRHGYPLGYTYDDFPDSVCVVTSGTQKITELSVKVGDRVFNLTGTSNRFPVSEALATALKTASDENAKVRLVAENGEVIDSEIGKATVRAWKAIY
jgi:hypothetical protein